MVFNVLYLQTVMLVRKKQIFFLPVDKFSMSLEYAAKGDFYW